jgi:hypothetical protein
MLSKKNLGSRPEFYWKNKQGYYVSCEWGDRMAKLCLGVTEQIAENYLRYQGLTRLDCVVAQKCMEDNAWDHWRRIELKLLLETSE